MNEEKHEGARVLYELEMGLWEVGLSKLRFDEEHDRFPLSRWALRLLPREGRLEAPARARLRPLAAIHRTSLVMCTRK